MMRRTAFLFILAVCVSWTSFTLAASSDLGKDGKLIILGFDGVDAKLVERWMGEGELPHLAKLATRGGYARLYPPVPAQTPVSWSSFSTGRDPGGTGIYDFLVRNPETYYPDFALVKRKTENFLWGRATPMVLAVVAGLAPVLLFAGVGRLLRLRKWWVGAVLGAAICAAPAWWIGKTWIPPQITVAENRRQGIPFWKIAGENGYTCTIARLPASFPADPFPNGKLLAGLGVPDMRGRIGSPTLMTSDPFYQLRSDNQFSIEIVRLPSNKGTMTVGFPGPKDILFGSGKTLTCPMRITVDLDSRSVEIETDGGLDRVVVHEGQWSRWTQVRFKINPIIKLWGYIKFRVLSIQPEVTIYTSSLQWDPSHLPPKFLISSPRSWAAQLKEKLGPFKTTGWAVDTWGVTEGAVGEDVFWEDLRETAAEFRRMLKTFLSQDQRVLVHYFEYTDRVGHIFYRFMDEHHPAYDPVRAPKYRRTFLQAYKLMDSIVGEVMSRLGPNDLLIVLSDHGFSTWRRSFNINTWLAKEGYIALSSPTGKVKRLEDLFGHGQFWENVDWSRTRAYHLGLGGLFINLEGREAHGIVRPGKEYEDLRREIASKLMALVDPETGLHPVSHVYFREEVYSQFDPALVPDMIVTTTEGYRISWQSALGGMPPTVFMDNKRAWSGDHCTLDPEAVPGVLFANVPLLRQRVDMLDVYPTILKVLGLRPVEEVRGRPFL